MMVTAQDDRLRRRGAALTFTLLFHGALLLLFIFYRIVTPVPPFPEGGGMGMTIDLGFSEMGQGDNNDAMSMSGTDVTAASPETTPEDPLLVDDDPANAINTPDTKSKPKDKPKDKPKPKDQVSNGLQNAMNAWDKPGEGGQGSTGQPGNVGAPDGTPGGDGSGVGNGSGFARGNGWDVSLAGRTILRKPHITERPDHGGKVVLNIWVDRDGNMLRVSQNTSKSTTLDQTLVMLATKAALGCKFSPNVKAAGEQIGEMTFVFVLQ